MPRSTAVKTLIASSAPAPTAAEQIAAMLISRMNQRHQAMVDGYNEDQRLLFKNARATPEDILVAMEAQAPGSTAIVATAMDAVKSTVNGLVAEAIPGTDGDKVLVVDADTQAVSIGTLLEDSKTKVVAVDVSNLKPVIAAPVKPSGPIKVG